MYNMTILLQIFKIAFEQRGKNHVSQNLTRILTKFFLILFFFLQKKFFSCFFSNCHEEKVFENLEKNPGKLSNLDYISSNTVRQI